MKLVIVGNGVAGVMTARFVAEHDPASEIVIYTEEPYPYYPRPKLIDFLAEKVAVDQVFQYPDSWYTSRGIRVLRGQRVVRVEPQQKRVVLADGETDPYDKLVLATGAEPWMPPVSGADRRGVYTLRCLDDAKDILACAKEAGQAVIIGGGLLGLDTSMGLLSQGVRTVIVEALPRLLPKQLDREGAALLKGLIENADRRIITDTLCEELQGDERVRAVRLSNGEVVPADLVIVSTGVRPRTTLAQRAGLTCGRGIVVNERLETSDPNIYAVGDAAEFEGVVWAIIPAALAQARVAAAQIAGEGNVVYDGIVPITTLKVTGINLMSIGEVNPEGDDYRELRRVDPYRGLYEKLTVHNGRVVGGILLNDLSDAFAIRRLIDGRVDVSEHVDSLLAEDFELRDLL